MVISGLKKENQLVCKKNRCGVIGKHHYMMQVAQVAGDAENVLGEVGNSAGSDGKAEKCSLESVKEEELPH